jgi:dihydrolipoamide dehydrogenase
MADKVYDVAVIGSGPGGYVGAIRMAQLGMSVALIEKYDTLGGTCLNVGCIPSKALLDSSEHFHSAETTFATHGIKISKPKVDMPQMIKRKAEVVKQTCDGVAYLMKKNKVDVITGHATFVSSDELEVVGKKKASVKAKKFVIATGSKPATLPFVEIDKERIITSTEALELTEVPKTMVVMSSVLNWGLSMLDWVQRLP